jgi:hypothetical protein
VTTKRPSTLAASDQTVSAFATFFPTGWALRQVDTPLWIRETLHQEDLGEWA